MSPRLPLRLARHQESGPADVFPSRCPRCGYCECECIPEGGLCVAPLESGEICTAPAVTRRVVESVSCALCAEHAAELDAERAEGRE